MMPRIGDKARSLTGTKGAYSNARAKNYSAGGPFIPGATIEKRRELTIRYHHGGTKDTKTG
jgi:hypothetical protein